jgi:hypothetical protein
LTPGFTVAATAGEKIVPGDRVEAPGHLPVAEFEVSSLI